MTLAELWRAFGVFRQPHCPDQMPCPASECLGDCKTLDEACAPPVYERFSDVVLASATMRAVEGEDPMEQYTCPTPNKAKWPTAEAAASNAPPISDLDRKEGRAHMLKEYRCVCGSWHVGPAPRRMVNR